MNHLRQPISPMNSLAAAPLPISRLPPVANRLFGDEDQTQDEMLAELKGGHGALKQHLGNSDRGVDFVRAGSGEG